MHRLGRASKVGARPLALTVAAIVVGAAILTPAVSGAAAFLTKQKANKLFLGNTVEVTTTTTVANNTGQSMTVLCPPGQQAVGGGAKSPGTVINGTEPNVMFVLESYPVINGGRSVGWTVEVFNSQLGGGSGPISVTASAVCSK
jgi:hypothetical protein